MLTTGGYSAVGVGFDSDHATVVNSGTITVAQLGGEPPQAAAHRRAGQRHRHRRLSRPRALRRIVTNDGAIGVIAHRQCLRHPGRRRRRRDCRRRGFDHRERDLRQCGRHPGARDRRQRAHARVDHDRRRARHRLRTRHGHGHPAPSAPTSQVHNGGTTNVSAYASSIGIDALGNTVSAGNTGHIIARRDRHGRLPAFGISTSGTQSAHRRQPRRHHRVRRTRWRLASTPYFDESGSAHVTNDRRDRRLRPTAAPPASRSWATATWWSTGSAASSRMQWTARPPASTCGPSTPTHRRMCRSRPAVRCRPRPNSAWPPASRASARNVDIHHGGTTDVDRLRLCARHPRGRSRRLRSATTGQVSVNVTGTDGDVVGIGARTACWPRPIDRPRRRERLGARCDEDGHGPLRVQPVGQCRSSSATRRSPRHLMRAPQACSRWAMASTIDDTGVDHRNGGESRPASAAYVGARCGLATVTHDGSIDA